MSTASMRRAAPLHRLRQVASHLRAPHRSLPSVASPLSARTFARSASSSAPSRPWIFTTSAAFHGKPGYRPAPASAGLGPDHPLVAWRDQAMREGNAPKEGAGHDWWLAEGIPESDGSGSKGVVLGVADGVGGWEESGIDPSHFSQSLMWFARERVRTARWALPPPTKAGEGDESGMALVDLLDGAYEDVMQEEGVVAGSSTACVVALDAETGMLHAANLGDSGFIVLRPQPASDLPPTPPPSPPTDASTFTPPTPSVLYRLVHEQTPQIHFFNAPLQLSKLPAAERAQADKAEKDGKWLRDLPRDADVVNLQLEDGDVVLLVTDGYSDNIWAEGETTRLVELVRTKLDSEASSSSASKDGTGASPSPGSRSASDAALASSIAQTAVNFARVVSVRPDVYTPFAAEAKRWDVKGMVGGKVDDVTVVCAVVRRGGDA
ncbi:uncharacterized protein RHOBADRAFT_53095 [Rhodotorula graminis WP1]|uniref:Protein phosphatase n=1 Tax=Rhodotorula graminis (strain WP1) TaxID=578459 RepID=A0A194S5V7_RHOGW|nr:uncharacterized protein RHOBADRAFT_53095 [Rhodotorula graminis WP1]KPV76108.1 hypothetical protein RHOBADRAFT_53095 [Rhodotorula graminis WP1]